MNSARTSAPKMPFCAVTWFSINFTSLCSLGSVLGTIALVLSGEIDTDITSALRERKAAEIKPIEQLTGICRFSQYLGNGNFFSQLRIFNKKKEITDYKIYHKTFSAN